MTTDTTRARDEQGMALISVILLLMLVSGVCAALAVSGQTETQAAYNLDTSAQARAAAQAGLTAGVQAAVTQLNASGAGTPQLAINELLAGPDADAAAAPDNGSLAGLPAPGGTAMLGALQGVTYAVQGFDDDDPARLPAGFAMPAAAQTGENGVATQDNNGRMVVRATGFGRNNTTVILEGIIGVTQLPAIVTDGDLEVFGNVTVTGANGGVHANGDLDISSGAVDISKDATASGAAAIHPMADIGGESGSGYPVIPVPAVNAADHLLKADYILGSDGRITNPAGVELCNASVDLNKCAGPGGPPALIFGWSFNGVVGGVGKGTAWNVAGNTLRSGTYYVKGHARMTGSPGSPVAPKSLSVIAEGNIDISGNPDVQPDAPELLFVTNMDLSISGGLATPILIEGQVLVREQFEITGVVEIAGQILVDNAANISNLVVNNRIGGVTTITYNGIAGTGTFSLGGWREIK